MKGEAWPELLREQGEEEGWRWEGTTSSVPTGSQASGEVGKALPGIIKLSIKDLIYSSI